MLHFQNHEHPIISETTQIVIFFLPSRQLLPMKRVSIVEDIKICLPLPKYLKDNVTNVYLQQKGGSFFQYYQLQ